MDSLERMIKVWRTALDSEQISEDSDFYDVGGHSLTAIKLAAHIREEFGVDIGIRSVLRAATPRRLTEVVDQSAASKSHAALASRSETTMGLSGRPARDLRTGGDHVEPLPRTDGPSSFSDIGT